MCRIACCSASKFFGNNLTRLVPLHARLRRFTYFLKTFMCRHCECEHARGRKQPQSKHTQPKGRRTNFFWYPVLPHKCGVPPGYGTPHLCGSEGFCRAPQRKPERTPNPRARCQLSPSPAQRLDCVRLAGAFT